MIGRSSSIRASYSFCLYFVMLQACCSRLHFRQLVCLSVSCCFYAVYFWKRLSADSWLWLLICIKIRKDELFFFLNFPLGLPKLRWQMQDLKSILKILDQGPRHGEINRGVRYRWGRHQPLIGSPLPKGGGESYTSPTTQHFPATLQRHCTENSKQIFPEMKLRCYFAAEIGGGPFAWQYINFSQIHECGK